MIVPDPWREAEDVSHCPVETLPVNYRPAAALHDMVDDTSRVAMGFCLLAWPQHLNPAIDGRHHRAARKGIRVLQSHTVIGAAVPFGHLRQPTFRLRPAKVEQWRILVRAPVTDRQEPSRAVAANRFIPRRGDRLTSIRAGIILLK